MCLGGQQAELFTQLLQSFLALDPHDTNSIQQLQQRAREALGCERDERVDGGGGISDPALAAAQAACIQKGWVWEELCELDREMLMYEAWELIQRVQQREQLLAGPR